MKTSLQLLCLLVAVISSKAQRDGPPITACLADLQFVAFRGGCEDIDAWITCLEKILKDPPKYMSNHEIWGWGGTVNYYRYKKTLVKPCPALERNGSCISKEMQKCEMGRTYSATNFCRKIFVKLDCLVELNATCSNYLLVRNMRETEHDKESCVSGEKKLEMEREICHWESWKCTSKFYVFYERQQFKEAVKEIEPARKCLEIMPCESQGYAEREINQLKGILEDYESGVLTGKCSKMALGKCIDLVWDVYHRDQDRDKRQIRLPCDPEIAAPVRKCVDEIKPHCTSVLQKKYFNKFVKIMNRVECYDTQ